MHTGQFAQCLIDTLVISDPSVPVPDPAIALPFFGNNQDLGVSDNCAFLYATAATPVITSFSTLTAKAGQAVTVSGSNLGGGDMKVRAPHAASFHVASLLSQLCSQAGFLLPNNQTTLSECIETFTTPPHPPCTPVVPRDGAMREILNDILVSCQECLLIHTKNACSKGERHKVNAACVQVYLYPIPPEGLERWQNVYRQDSLLDPVKLPDLTDPLVVATAAPVTDTQPGKLKFEIPPEVSTGYYWPIVVSGSAGAADYGQLKAADMSVFVPSVITSVTPSALPWQGGFVTIKGSGFPYDASKIVLAGLNPVSALIKLTAIQTVRVPL
jgi:hypothetical protein